MGRALTVPGRGATDPRGGAGEGEVSTVWSLNSLVSFSIRGFSFLSLSGFLGVVAHNMFLSPVAVCVSVCAVMFCVVVCLSLVVVVVVFIVSVYISVPPFPSHA